MRKAIEKVVNTEERKQVQKELREFFRRNPEIVNKELRPTGYQVQINTIPKENIEEFLNIVSKLK